MKKKIGFIVAVGMILIALTTGCANKNENNEADYTFIESISMAEESTEKTEEETTTTEITTLKTTTTSKATTTSKTATTSKAATTSKTTTTLKTTTTKNITTTKTIKKAVTTTTVITTAPFRLTDKDIDGFIERLYTSVSEEELTEYLQYLRNILTEEEFTVLSQRIESLTDEEENYLFEKRLMKELLQEFDEGELGTKFVRDNDERVIRVQRWRGSDDYYNHVTYLYDSEYKYYNSLPRYTNVSDWVNYIYENELILQDIANGWLVSGTRTDRTAYEMMIEAVKFVQAIPYETDIDSTGYNEYPKYPYETLYENCGDCEDVSFLVAGILRSMGFEVCLLDLPRHIAVGLRTDSDDSNFYINGLGYYYIECTNEGWKVGEVPESFEDALNGAPAYILKPIE